MLKNNRNVCGLLSFDVHESTKHGIEGRLNLRLTKGDQKWKTVNGQLFYNGCKFWRMAEEVKIIELVHLSLRTDIVELKI